MANIDGANESVQEKRTEVIMKLLAKAESTQFPEEAKAFSTKAQQLMIKWSIDDAMLAKVDKSTIDITKIDVDGNEYFQCKSTLLNTIAQFNNCRVIQSASFHYVTDLNHKKGHKRVKSVSVIGAKSDRDFAQQLWLSLLIQADIEFNDELTQDKMKRDMEWADITPFQRGGFRIKWHNTFMRGFILGVDHQFSEIKRQTIVEAEKQYSKQSVAMVLVSKQEAVDKHFAILFPRTGKARSSAGNGSRNALNSGRDAGLRANIGGNKSQIGNRKMIQQ